MNPTRTKLTASITKRISPCTCGCKGTDSWHAKSFDRVIRDVKDDPGTARTAYGGGTSFEKAGVARFPWGLSRVVWHRYHADFKSGEWLLDLDSMIDSMNEPGSKANG